MPIATNPEPRIDSNQFKLAFEADGLGRYTIDVSLPAKREPGETFPVILAIDGNLIFDTVQAYVHGGFASTWSYLPPAIVVGVGYPEGEGLASFYGRRNYDFFGEWDMADDVGQALQDAFSGCKAAEGKPELEMKAGGAARFSEFLRDELLPGLAEHFPINLLAKHTLIGVSSGGHYVLRAIFDSDSPFSRYISVSPAFGAAKGSIRNLEADYAASHDDLEANLFVCCGREEVGADRIYALGGAGGGVVWAAEQFAIRGWKSAHVDWEIMNNEDHPSGPQRGIAAGLRSVFQKRPGIDADAVLPYSADQEPDPIFSLIVADRKGRDA